MYNYTDSFYAGNACITVNNYKKGKVYYIGGGADEETLKCVAGEITVNSGIYYMEAPLGLEVYTRNCNGNEYLIICNHTGEEQEFNGTAFKPYESRIISI